MKIRGYEQILNGTIQQTQLGLGNPVNPQDAVTLAYLQAFNLGFTLKYQARVTTQAATDVPFSSFASNTITTSATVTTIDGVTLAVGDRVLIRSYTGANAPYNGIYTYTSTSGTAQFTRTTDASTTGTGSVTDLAVGDMIAVEDGSTSGGTLWILSPTAVGTDTLTLNTSAINWNLIFSGNATGTPVYTDTVSGTPNGTLTTFTLASGNTPKTGSLQLYLNGLRQRLGTDYTISGSTITMTTAPYTGDLLDAPLYFK